MFLLSATHIMRPIGVVEVEALGGFLGSWRRLGVDDDYRPAINQTGPGGGAAANRVNGPK